MPEAGISRKDLIRKFRALGYSGPFSEAGVKQAGSFVVAKGFMLTFRAYIDLKEKRECYNERPDPNATPNATLPLTKSGHAI